MDSGRTNLVNAFRALIKGETLEPPIIGTVIAIEGNNVDIKPLSNDDADILSVRLVANDEPEERFIIFPKVQSVVIINMLNKDEGYVAMFSKVDAIELKGSEFGGLIKIEDLVTKINRLEDKMNEFINIFSLHFHPSNGAPPTPPFPTTIAPLTNRNDMENEDIKHGG